MKAAYFALVPALAATPVLADDVATSTGAGAGFAMLAIMFVAYFFPAGIAVLRGHSNALAIGMLHLFLGWTVLGWVGALVWACTNSYRTQHS